MQNKKQRYRVYTKLGAQDVDETSSLLRKDTSRDHVIYDRRQGGRRMIVIDGEMLSVEEWADRVHIPKKVILSRLFEGMPDREAVHRPWRPHQRRLKRTFPRMSYHTQEQAASSK